MNAQRLIDRPDATLIDLDFDTPLNWSDWSEEFS